MRFYRTLKTEHRKPRECGDLSPVHDWNTTTINGAVQTRTHGPAHELLTMSGAQVTNSPRTLTYDTKGNMTTDDRGCGMTWDFDNMLQSFAANGVTDLKNATYANTNPSSSRGIPMKRAQLADESANDQSQENTRGLIVVDFNNPQEKRTECCNTSFTVTYFPTNADRSKYLAIYPRQYVRTRIEESPPCGTSWNDREPNAFGKDDWDGKIVPQMYHAWKYPQAYTPVSIDDYPGLEKNVSDNR